MRLDLHVHLAGIGAGGTGCAVSPRMRRTVTYHALMRLTGMHRHRGDEDRAFARYLGDMVRSSAELDAALVFGMDGVYDAAGQLDPRRSHLYIPNAHVFAVCREQPELLPVISVNPERPDAVAELERWGPRAIALKWLAPLQRFELSASRHAEVIRTLARLQLPVIAHSGCEHTFPGMEQRLGDPELYEPLLAAGVPVIFSHCGTGSLIIRGHDYSAGFLRMLQRHEHAFGDTAAFCSLVRLPELRRFVRSGLVERLFHGSDFPIPSASAIFLHELGLEALRLQGIRHPLDRDVRTKKAMGVPEVCFTGASRLLGDRIRRWQAARSQ